MARHEGSQREKCKSVAFWSSIVERRCEMCPWALSVEQLPSSKGSVLKSFRLPLSPHVIIGGSRICNALRAFPDRQGSKSRYSLADDEGSGGFWRLDPTTTGSISTFAFPSISTQLEITSRLLFAPVPLAAETEGPPPVPVDGW
jgi:hypothetical protein